MAEGRPAVFLDRDGVILADFGESKYVTSLSQVKLLEPAVEALRKLSRSPFRLIVVTNQAAIAKGLLTEKALDEIHASMSRQLGAKGCRLDGIYYCRHQDSDSCSCRKPKPGMLLQAAREKSIDLSKSFMVGDAQRDIDAGKAAGCVTILVKSGKPLSGDEEADYVVADLLEASKIILGE